MNERKEIDPTLKGTRLRRRSQINRCQCENWVTQEEEEEEEEEEWMQLSSERERTDPTLKGRRVRRRSQMDRCRCEKLDSYGLRKNLLELS